MPYAKCDRCHAHFATERKTAAQARCSACDTNLRAISREEALARLAQRRTARTLGAKTEFQAA